MANLTTIVIHNVDKPTLKYQLSRLEDLIRRNNIDKILAMDEWDSICGVIKLLQNMVKQ